jgi:hypothetical protein
MTIKTLTRSEALKASAESGIINGGIGRGSFQSGVPCMVGSMSRDIKSISDCPSKVMAQWMFEAVISINDGIEITRHGEWAGQIVNGQFVPGAFAQALALYSDDEELPSRILWRFVSEYVLPIARESFDHEKWPDVLAVIDGKNLLCARALRGDFPTQGEWAAEAAWAAGAAEAAWAAEAAGAAYTRMGFGLVKIMVEEAPSHGR